MKSLFSFFALTLLATTQPAQARGGLSSGGISPPAPQAVVIQEMLHAGERPSREVERAVRERAERDMESGDAVVFKRSKDKVQNGYWRMNWCVEYRHPDLTFAAFDQFRQELASFENISVGSNDACR